MDILQEVFTTPEYVSGVYIVVTGCWFMVLKATFNNISVLSCRLVLLVEVTGVLGENHRPVAS